VFGTAMVVSAYSVAASTHAAGLIDQPYPGALTLGVDLTDAGRRITKVVETIPVQPGEVTLFYPQWLPGDHAPSGPIDGVTGLIITSGGQRIIWRRDLEDMFTLHVDVPEGSTSLNLDFKYLSPTEGGGTGDGISATTRLVDLNWNQVAFYPAGYTSRSIEVRPSVKLPMGWNFATALDTLSAGNGSVQFAPVSFEKLVDSPLVCGLNFERLDLAPGAKVPVHLNVVADHPADLIVKEEQLKAYQRLVTQVNALFGAHHYDHYDFLMTLSEDTGHFGLEHSQSSDDRLSAAFFIDPETYLSGADLLPHEYVHSWNGKFRRPAGLATPHFNLPMHGDLLWVYEGLTEYLGEVLTARSGIYTPEQFRDALALAAAEMDKRPGRGWRPLQDTADAAQRLYYTPDAWSNWRRGVDFYSEGLLLWLDVDTRIRERSTGKRSLDDFLRAFYGVDDGSYVVMPYAFEDIVSALNKVQPDDWNTFLRQRLDSTDPAAPLGGLARGGWALTYTDTPTELFKAKEKVHKHVDLIDSLGVDIDAGDSVGTLRDVLWKGPAFAAGLAPGMKIIAVNGDKYDPDQLMEAIKAAKTSTQPLELLVQNLDTFMTVRIDDHGGLLYPHLVRTTGADLITEIAKAKK